VSEGITILANGREERFDAPRSVAEFVMGHGWKPTQVVVERNGSVVPRGDFSKVVLANGDRVEVIVPVAGG